MTEAAVLAIVSALIAAAPGIIADVEKLIADLKGNPPAPGGEVAAVKAAMDPLLAQLRGQ